MISGSAAGHTFENGVCVCGRKWVDIRNCSTSDIGEEGIAHMGRLTTNELIQIETLRTKEDAALSKAFGW